MDLQRKNTKYKSEFQFSTLTLGYKAIFVITTWSLRIAKKEDTFRAPT